MMCEFAAVTNMLSIKVVALSCKPSVMWPFTALTDAFGHLGRCKRCACAEQNRHRSDRRKPR
eukprot:6198424-Pleurochrysis_carterae.AAC.1